MYFSAKNSNPNADIFIIVIFMVVKIIELIGSSPAGWQQAAEDALNEAAKTIKNIKSMYIKRCTAKVENNKIVEYRANVKIAFVVDHKHFTATLTPIQLPGPEAPAETVNPKL